MSIGDDKVSVYDGELLGGDGNMPADDCDCGGGPGNWSGGVCEFLVFGDCIWLSGSNSIIYLNDDSQNLTYIH